MSHYLALALIHAEDEPSAEATAADLLAPYSEALTVEPHWDPISPDALAHILATASTPLPDADSRTYDGWVHAVLADYEAPCPVRVSRDPETGVVSGAVMRTTNPEGYWDYWMLGGLWEGAFLVKETVSAAVGQSAGAGARDAVSNGRASIARKRDIDFAQMETFAGLHADVLYDRFEEVTHGLEVPPRWADVQARFPEEPAAMILRYPYGLSPLERARTAYREYPWVQAARPMSPAFVDLHEHWCVGTGGRDAFVARAVAQSRILPYAIITQDGQWHARGRMGALGIGSEELPRDVWDAQARDLLDGASEDAWIAAIDLHV